MWFAIQTADAPSLLVSITATRTESSLLGPVDRYLDCFIFPPRWTACTWFFLPNWSAACPLAPTFISTLIFFFFFTPATCTTVPLCPSSLPGGIYQAAGAGGLQHRLFQPTLWAWDQEEEGEKDVWILMSTPRTQVYVCWNTHTVNTLLHTTVTSCPALSSAAPSHDPPP